MPKIIHNLNARIEQAAMELFNTYDYNQVDMKMIAKKCNIAVGTLYNYYPNKKQLFIHVLEESWSTTSHSLDEIYEMALLPEEKALPSVLKFFMMTFMGVKEWGSSFTKYLLIKEMEAENDRPIPSNLLPNRASF